DPVNVGGTKAAGTGTANRVAKWTETGGAGTLGDSAITEVNSAVVVGSLAQTGTLQIAGAAGQDVFAGMGPDINAGPAFNFGYAGLSIGRSAGFFNVRPDASATAPNPSLRFMTTNVERMIVTNAGNVGIGTSGPGAKLDVVGNINTSTQYNLGGSRVLITSNFFGNIFAGNGAGASNTSGSGNSFFGLSAGQSNMTGGNNSFFGKSAGLNNTAGNNSFFGEQSGFGNSSGQNNSSFGQGSGRNNGSGSDNASFGYRAGFNNTASGNSFFGSQSGDSVTSGANNSFFGRSAGAAVITGGSNSFFGHNAGILTTSSSNSFFGSSAGVANTSGTFNSFFGTLAGSANTTASSNDFFGAFAGAANTTGYNNAFFGRQAGEENTTGSNNAFFGSTAGGANTSGENNSFFGVEAGFSNGLGIRNSYFGRGAGRNGHVGSDNTFVGYVAGDNSTGSDNTFVGSDAGGSNTSGYYNTFVGRNAGDANTTGDNNTIIGRNADVASGALTFATAVGAGAVVDRSNAIVLGRSNDDVIIPGTLELTLTQGGTYPLCFVPHGINFTPTTCSSSLRYKTNLAPFRSGLSLINQLRPISYDWKKGGMKDVGFGAEDVEKIDPRFVTYNRTGEVEGVRYDHLSTVFVNAFKEQQTQIERQQRQINQLTQIVCRSRRGTAVCRKTSKRTH
ncbi:MAG: tail fiber domain-containing protein, partial [Pyrinomonadaceae bacterium]